MTDAYDVLRKADAAGDTESVKKLIAYIQSQEGVVESSQVEGQSNSRKVPDSTPKDLLSRIGTDISNRAANVNAMYARNEPAVMYTGAAPIIAAGQMLGGVADTGVEVLKSGYNQLVPQAIKDSLVNKPIADIKGLYNQLMPQGAKDVISSGYDTVAGTLGEAARQNPTAALTLDSLAQAPMAGAMLKGAGLAGREALATGTDALAAATPKSSLAKVAQSTLKLPVAIRPEKQLAMGEDLLALGLKPTDYAKLTERIKEVSGKTRRTLAPVADKPFAVEVIPQDLADSPFLGGHKTLPSQGAMQGLTGKPVQSLQLTNGEAQKIKQAIDMKISNHYNQEMRGVPTAWADEDLQAAKKLRNALQKGIEEAAPDVKELNTENSKLLRLRPAIAKAANVALDSEGDIASKLEHPIKFVTHPLRNAEVGLAGKIYNTQQSGPQSGLGKFVKKFLDPGAVAPMAPEEASSIVDSVVLQLPAPERGFVMGEGSAVKSPGRPAKVPAEAPAQKALPAPEPPSPTEGSGIADSLARMFQIAQSPQGKKLLIERLSQEEKYSALVDELKQIPTTKALPAGQGFELPSSAETANVLATPKVAKALGVKNIPGGGAWPGEITTAEKRRLNALARGLSNSNR